MTVHLVKLSDLAKELDVLRALKADVEKAEEAGEVGWYDEDKLEALEDLERHVRQGSLAEAAEFENVMIPESDWEEYCQDLAEDLGDIRRDSPLTNYVDWCGWAEALKEGYEELEYAGETYYRRVH